jgi:large subunit ribosomal protein L15
MREHIKKLPKLRGYGINRARTVNNERVLPVVVNVAALEGAFKAGATVTPKTLIAAGVLSTVRRKAPAVKILGNGDLSIKLNVEGCQVSQSAKTKIEAAGGTIN